MIVNFILFATLLCLFIPIYVYVGYPLLLWVMTRKHKEPTHKISDITPSVTLVISCYNEESVIKEKLENSLKLEYPKELLEILVVSDGSEDGTDEIVKSFSDKGIKLLRQEGRLGKTMGLNLALDNIDSEIVVFSDANAIYEPSAINKLVRNFYDKDVGYVVGAALYTDGGESASAQNEDLYWRYEMAIKSMESKLHSVVGGDGAIYAIRRSLWKRLDRRDINDFVNPLQIIDSGYRGVFDPAAICYEETAGNFEKEIARKERIVNRSIRGLLSVKSVMNPLKTGVFALEVVSHKLLRWLIPVFLGFGVTGSCLLASKSFGVFYFITFCSFVVFALAFLASCVRDKEKLSIILSFPYYFVVVNVYAVRGVLSAARGKTKVAWSSARSESADTAKVLQSDLLIFVGWLSILCALAGSLIIGAV